ncbi:MAG: tetratricopeptide repeat protein [Candidatus Eisenbacteria bacterium]|uniref:Tetratricopeptide repeat protein n=1 Tax=Eiseniibacteriota bacterium TaxID=2212470 RepID=A0A956NC31_UNCEI|nr:tetratricopeptide repeat protein [Candidatus Eisenbacteria bacterium]MCB9462979.1 tetratricopeptide repeat protein [Candidatus Eisenbacteria bacterium]
MAEADPSAAPRLKARALFKRAYKAQQRGRLDDAARLYKESIQTHPTAEAYTYLGWTHAYRREYEQAIRYCKLAIDLDPAFGNAYNDLGAYLIERSEWDEAEPWLEAATRAARYVSYHLPYYNLGRLYEHRFQFDRAEAAYVRSTRLDPAFKPARRALGMLRARRN